VLFRSVKQYCFEYWFMTDKEYYRFKNYLRTIDNEIFDCNYFNIDRYLDKNNYNKLYDEIENFTNATHLINALLLVAGIYSGINYQKYGQLYEALDEQLQELN